MVIYFAVEPFGGKHLDFMATFQIRSLIDFKLNTSVSHYSLINVSSFYNSQETPNKQCLLKYNRHGFQTGVNVPKMRIKLQQFYFAFLVLFFGLLVSFVQFMRENIHYCFKQNQSFEIGNAQLAAKVEAEEVNQEVKQRKVSVVIEKIKVVNQKVNKKIKAAKIETNSCKQQNKVFVIIEKKEERDKQVAIVETVSEEGI